jgi:hypothetical protein
MTLFELDESLSLLMESATEAAADNSGEIPDELRQSLLDYCEAFGAKVDNIANYIKSQEFQARNAKSEIDRLQSRQAAAENKVERLKGLLKYFMETRGLRNMKGRLNTIWLRKNSQDSLVVDSIDQIPSEYWRVSISLPHPELEELLRCLPEEHRLRARLTPEDNDGYVRREPDNTKLRTALASGVPIQGAELRRGQHVRLTWSLCSPVHENGSLCDSTAVPGMKVLDEARVFHRSGGHHFSQLLVECFGLGQDEFDRYLSHQTACDDVLGPEDAAEGTFPQRSTRR